MSAPLSSRSHRGRPVLARAVAAAVLALSIVTGCDASGDSPGSPPVDDPAPSETLDDTAADPSSPTTSPDAVSLASVLPTAENFPEGIVAVSPAEAAPPHESDFDGTCLADLSDLGASPPTEPADEALALFEGVGRTSQAAIRARIATYDDEATLAAAFAAFAKTVRGCRAVSTTNARGLTYDLTVSIDDPVTVPYTDQQIQIDVSGEVTDPETFPYEMRYVVGRTGTHLFVIGASTLGNDEWGAVDLVVPLAVTQANRVAELR